MPVTLLTKPHERQERDPVPSDRYVSISEAPGGTTVISWVLFCFLFNLL